jgi:hypothetical protein
LGNDLRGLQIEEGGLQQNVDDLLIYSPTQDISNANAVTGDIMSQKARPRSLYSKFTL